MSSIEPSATPGPRSASELGPDELRRYARHIVLPEVGRAGQEQLKQSRVLLVGAGGLGSPAAMYLAAAGVGTLGIVDGDTVDVSNLQRQILHGESDLKRHKTASAADALRRINPHVVLELHPFFLDETNALELVGAYDIVVDGTDNFTTRYLVNDACVLTGVPNAYGSIFRFEGQASLFADRPGPCYRCLHPEPPPAGLIPNCAEGGVFGVLPGIIGTVQATEAIKYLLNRERVEADRIGESLRGRLLLFDALGMSFRTLKLRRDPNCPVCGDAPTITTLQAVQAACATNSSTEPTMNELTVIELKTELDGESAPVLLDVREDVERAISHIDPSLHIPMGEIPERLAELPRDGLVVYCKVGGRSARVIAFLEERGFTGLRNLTGGVTAWAREIDTSMEIY